jgi:glycosyltransferase involved in cell wall biosynthesis
MRIAFDAYHTLFPSGGIARYSRGLISALADAVPQEKITLLINSFHTKGIAWKPARGNVARREIVMPRRMLQGIWDALEWPPIEFFLGKTDIFHGLHFILPPTRGAKRVLTVHDLTYLRFPDYFTLRSLNEVGYKRELPRALNRADAVIAVSAKTRDDLIELMKVPEAKIKVVPEGVDRHFIDFVDGVESETVRKKYNLNRPYLLFLVGTPEPRKNLQRTVEAAAKAAPEIPLVVIGHQDSLRGLLGEAKGNIILPGFVPDDHLPCLLSGALISLYPSLYEGFGLPVLESMACGVPVITSNRGSLPEVAGDSALIVDPEKTDAIADAVITLLKDTSLRESMIVSGKARAADFTWHRTAVETYNLYRKIL